MSTYTPSDEKTAEQWRDDACIWLLTGFNGMARLCLESAIVEELDEIRRNNHA